MQSTGWHRAWNSAPDAFRYGLSAHTRRALLNAGYSTAESVARATDAELYRLPRIGPHRLRELRAVFPFIEGGRQ